MRKLVYLFELDSIRNSDNQMKLAMKALYREIIVNGNAVVVTFNQLIDSRFFLSLLNDKEWSDCILRLFRAGAIRISQYDSSRTPSQYLLSKALDSNEDYIFSGLPLKSNQKSLIALAKRCLMYSDLTELNEYIRGKRGNEEIRELFREQVTEEKNGKTKILIADSSLTNDEMLNTLNDLYAALNLILQFSDIQSAYNPPKDFDKEKEQLTLMDYFQRVEAFDPPDLYGWKEAITLLKDAFCDPQIKKNDRSGILKFIYNDYQTTAQGEDDFQKYALAQAIINLCYNYVCESSISNVSKHYDMNEFQIADSRCETFKSDFLLRLKKYYGDKKHWHDHFLTPERNDFQPYQFKKRWFFNLKRAMNIVELANLYKDEDSKKDDSKKSVPKIDDLLLPYEYKRFRQRFFQKGKILLFVVAHILITAFYLFIAFWIGRVLYDQIDDALKSLFQTMFLSFEVPRLLVMILSSFLALVAVQLLSLLLNKINNLANQDYTQMNDQRLKKKRIIIPTFGNCLEDFISRLADFVCALCSFCVPYANRKNADKLQPTKRDRVKMINYVSKSISEYQKYRTALSSSSNQSWMFDQSAVFPLVDTEEKGMDIRLTRIEEMTGKAFGIVYRSEYHTMVVDPAIKQIKPNSKTGEDNNIYPYERLAHSSDNSGIVAVPILWREGKRYFVLLRQYRHAIRREQICFPRGFGENGIAPLLNTQKELNEEIGAVLKNPDTGEGIHYNEDPNKNEDPTPALKLLGKITPDSGNQCDTVEIFAAELLSYKINKKHEGIINGIELEAEELQQMIRDNQIDDGYTIAAFALWMEKNTNTIP